MEWILALHEGDGDDVGARWPLRRSVGLGHLGSGRCGVRPDERISAWVCEIVHKALTISSNGAAVNPPPSVRRARRAIRGHYGGQTAMTSPSLRPHRPESSRPA